MLRLIATALRASALALLALAPSPAFAGAGGSASDSAALSVQQGLPPSQQALPPARARTAHVEAELVSARSAITPGAPLTVALRLRMDRGWHTYWRNPGDSGLPTTVAWTLPQGLTAGPIEWPAPKALPAGPLTNYGYENQVLLLTELRAAAGLEPGAGVPLRARVDWLVCKEICIPEGADLALLLPVARAGDGGVAQDPAATAAADDIDSARLALPRALSGWLATAIAHGATVVLRLTPPSAQAGEKLAALRFFPDDEGKVEAGAAQTVRIEPDGVSLTLPVASRLSGDFTRVKGVLTADGSFGAQGKAVAIDVPVRGAVTAGAPAGAGVAAGAGAEGLPFVLALAFALIGGVLLNLMPCVFPVLSLKVLGFAAHGASPRAMRLHGAAFSAGILISFWILATALLLLRHAGQNLGWGFQLQSPAVVASLAVLFFVLALNLSGVFEVRQLVPSSLATWSLRNSYGNDFLSGVLAAVVASPCSAPFMGAAIGYALGESALSTLTIFTALGAGMALPYALLAAFPAWRTLLPAPGAWMVRLKQFLAFPLYGTVVWLAWVLGAQLDNDAVARLGVMLLLIAAALWSWRAMRAGGSRAWGGVALASFAAALAAGAPVLSSSSVEGTEQAAAERSTAAIPVSPAGARHDAWQPYAPATLAAMTQSGRPVFVDFTAAWCVTCQVNKRLVLNTADVQRAFAAANVALVRADWTRRDPAIGEALAALGRNGVPVYVLYRPNAEPLLLPEVLQKSSVIDALATLDRPAIANR